MHDQLDCWFGLYVEIVFVLVDHMTEEVGHLKQEAKKQEKADMLVTNTLLCPIYQLCFTKVPAFPHIPISWWKSLYQWISWSEFSIYGIIK